MAEALGIDHRRLLAGVVITSAEPRTCGGCRFSEHVALRCRLFDSPLERDAVGLRVRLPVCLEAERRALQA